MKKNLKLTQPEKKAIAGLAAVVSFRVLGLTLVTPVFSLYALGLSGATPLLAGAALGAYGLSQALLQIPFGYFSDKLGRKPVVAGGLALFCAGSVIAAITSDIYMLVMARLLQGSGAVASACFAWVADSTDESRRNTAMGLLGMSVGMSVTFGMLLGPLIAGYAGVHSLFWLTAVLAATGVGITLFALEEPAKEAHCHDMDFELSPQAVFKFAFARNLLSLDVVGFLVSAGMVATFFSVPLRLKEHMAMNQLWMVYLPFSVLGVLVMALASRAADKGKQRMAMVTALVGLASAFMILSDRRDLWVTIVGFALFFSCFAMTEALLPAAVSKLADPRHKGSVIGMYNLSQFSGTFAGGLFAGRLHGSGEGIMFAAMAAGALFAAYLANGIDAGRKREEPA